MNSSIFDRTNGANTGFSQRLTGGTNEKYGIARTIKVMPGDTVKMEVFAKYVDRNTANWTSGFQTLMNSIAAASPTGGVVVDGSSYSTSTSSFPFPSQHNFADRTSGTAPRAFLNYISFDDNWNPILLDNSQTNFVRLSSTPIERGQDVAHERIAASFVVKQPGYVYIYLSNDETTPLEEFATPVGGIVPLVSQRIMKQRSRTVTLSCICVYGAGSLGTVRGRLLKIQHDTRERRSVIDSANHICQ